MRCLVASFGMFLLLSPALAHADVTPPDVEACASSAAGAACTVSGATGTCQDSTCTKLDYGNGYDGGAPGSIEYACRKCVTTTSPTNNPDGGTNPTPTNQSAGGCSLVPTSATGRELGALTFAGAFSLLFFVRRRRNRS